MAEAIAEKPVEHVEAPSLEPLRDAAAMPQAVEKHGLTVITQPGDPKEAQQALDEQMPRVRPNAKPRVSAPLMEAPKPDGAVAAEAPVEAKPGEKKPPKALQPGGERFEEAQRQKRELFEENQRLKAELAKREAPPARVDAPPAAAPVTADAFPTQEQWFAANPTKTFDDFLNARDDWRDQRREAVRQQTEAQAAMTRRANDDWTRYVTQAQEIENFDQTLTDAGFHENVRPDLQIAILQAPNGARVAHYLATHPDVRATIATLPTVDLYREIGALDAQFRSTHVGTTERAPIRSTAPAPFQPTGAGATMQSSESFFDTATKIAGQKTGTLAAYDELRRSHGMTGGRRRM